MKNKVLFVTKIHPLNFPFLYFFSFFYTVYFWQIERIPRRLVKKFCYIDSQQYSQRQLWLEAEERIFSDFKSQISSSVIRVEKKIFGKKIDFTALYYQHLAFQVRGQGFFLHLIEQWQKSQSLRDKSLIWFNYVDRNLSPNLSKVEGLKKSTGFTLLARQFDLGWIWLQSLTVLVKKIIFAFQKPEHSLNQSLCEFQILSSGMSPREITEKNFKIDCTFLSRRSDLSNYSVLYLLPTPPSPEVQSHYKNNNISWAVEKKSSQLLSLPQKLHYVSHLFQIMLAGVGTLKRRDEATLVSFALIRSLEWLHLGSQLKTQTYVTTVSAFWPENPLVSILNSLGIKTVTWSYGTSEIDYFERETFFTSCTFEGSAPLCQEVWFWNDMHRDMYINRHIDIINPNIKYISVGPIMAGDSKHILNPPPYSDENNHKELTITVFDFPIPSEETRAAAALVGVGPNRFTPEWSEDLYKHLNEYLVKNKNIHIKIKPKLALTNKGRIFAKSLFNLLEHERATLVDVDIDPYLAIGQSDLCISLPFSSAIFAALHSKRAGMFYDPLQKIIQSVPREVHPLVIQGKDNLFKELDLWQTNPEQYCINQKSMKDSLRWRGPDGDPVENFYNYL